MNTIDDIHRLREVLNEAFDLVDLIAYYVEALEKENARLKRDLTIVY